MSYLLSASLVLLAVWPAYHLLLRCSDRYQINRWLLLLGVLTVIALPLIPLASPAPEMTELVRETIDYAVKQTALEVTTVETVSVASEVPPLGEQLSPAAPAAAAPTRPALTWAMGYMIGLALMLMITAIRLLALLTLHLRSRPNGDRSYRLLHPSAKPNQSFTFGHFLYFSIDVPDQPDFDHILAHERVHARQFHSLDILLGEALVCIFWFHPAAWWLRTKLRANLEYLVDKSVINSGQNRRAYQLALVRQSQGSPTLALALPFSEPTLKSRITRLTGLPQHWVVAGIATVSMICWLGIAGLTVFGTSSDYELTGEDPYVTYFEDRLPEDIHSFDLYSRRIPTVDEYYQIRAILAKIPGTEFFLYKNPKDDGYSLRLDHGLNVPAELHRLPINESPTQTFRIGLIPNEGTYSHFETEYPTTGKFTPVAERNLVNHPMADGRLENMRIFSQVWLNSPQNMEFNELASDEELVVRINGEKIPLRPSEIVHGKGNDNHYYLLDNGQVAPVGWDQQNMYPPGQRTAYGRMAELLDCPGQKDNCGLRIFNKIEAEPDNRTWFESLDLPEHRGIIARYNDRSASLDMLLSQDFGPNSIIQAGYRYDRGSIYLQVIDDAWGQVTRAARAEREQQQRDQDARNALIQAAPFMWEASRE